jgi:hypothetical protein
MPPGRVGGRFRTATPGGKSVVQEVAFITLVIITVLPGTAKIGSIQLHLVGGSP